ncbi:MAG: protein jag [Spirochaetales bacterium]|nr:protein jag [Spirochaetales bacterium]
MTHEFEAKTENEAIAKAMAELGLHESEFDVEILDSGRKGLFKKGGVRIRVYTHDSEPALEEDEESLPYEPNPELERKVTVFVETMIKKMGFLARVSLTGRERNKIILDLLSEDANLLIGKHGKNLDSLQVLANVYAMNLLDGKGTHLKVVLDAENYRNRREDHLVNLALRTAQQVRRTRTSKLLEPMNPFERRLIHTALNDMKDITTESEGDGLIKQVRVSYVDKV